MKMILLVTAKLFLNRDSKKINLLEPLPETENSSKGTILLKSNIRPNKIPQSSICNREDTFACTCRDL